MFWEKAAEWKQIGEGRMAELRVGPTTTNIPADRYQLWWEWNMLCCDNRQGRSAQKSGRSGWGVQLRWPTLVTTIPDLRVPDPALASSTYTTSYRYTLGRTPQIEANSSCDS